MNPTPQQIRAARESIGFTQDAAAKAVFVSLRTWQQWEAGDRKMHQAFWTLFNQFASAYQGEGHPGEGSFH